MDNRQITPEMREMARQELAKREMAKRQTIGSSSPDAKDISNQLVQKLASKTQQNGDVISNYLSSLRGEDKSKQIFQEANPLYMNDLAGGLASGYKSMMSNVPNLSMMTPERFQSALPYKGEQTALKKFDPYGAFGTTDKSIFTPGGFVQTLGELATPLPPIVKGAKKGIEIAKKGIDLISPGKYAESLANDLAQGAKNTQEASKNIAREIKLRYADRIAEPRSYYDFIDNVAGEGRLYNTPNPIMTTALDKEKSILNKIKDLNVGDLYANFKANPNYKNAHALQSELGLMIDETSKGVRQGSRTREELNHLQNVRSQLKSDIHDYLDREGQKLGYDLTGKYKTATKLYEQNVAPYLATKMLRDLTRQNKNTVPNIEKIFSNPSDIENLETGFKKPGHANKILEDLSDATKKQILFKKSGGFKNLEKPKMYAKKLNDALQTDYSHLGNEDLLSRLNEIKNRARNKDFVTKLTYRAPFALLGEEAIRRNL